MKVLITGVAGFIGYHLAQKLLSENIEVVGIDNINDYYDVNLKYARLAEAGIYSSNENNFSGGVNRTYQRIEFHSAIISNVYGNYTFYRANLEDKEFLFSLFQKYNFTHVINLAAQAGVRYSIENPDVYIQSNINGFFHILEACRHFPVEHLVYASSSSIYGANSKIPFSPEDKTDSPVSLYAATKKANELMAHTYSHLYKIPTTGLRFFTVYGPWGRPDMAPMLFADAISRNCPIKVFNNGNMERDFTYVDDIVNGIRLVVSAKSSNLFNIHNIGNGSPVNLLDFIEVIENSFSRKVEKNFMPLQQGDVEKTWADTSSLKALTNFVPSKSLSEGVFEFAKWYKAFYSLKI
jgi:UDP-glucuronate 4-epimerase